ncbi:MAG: maleate cis-trans isomerase family protein [Yoonia sp.]|uniref:maleate cis-trans isomerase family protein n=1 Tax=Yoonia sp. TaxID=2212373 RepID=UPI003EF2B69A
MRHLPYTLTDPIGQAATLGLIVLQVDQTIEQDFRRLFADPEIALYVSRIPSGAELTPETIAQMAADLPQAARLLPPAARFDVIAYACTSGTTLIGADRVTQLVQGQATTRAVTNPLTASLAALSALYAQSIAIVSPYIPAVAVPIRDAFVQAGFEVPATLSFGEEIEANVARIDPADIHAAAVRAAQTPGVEAVFLSCTNLRTLDIIDDLEHEIGLPVVSSNQALAWHMARLAGVSAGTGKFGALLRL